MRTKKQQTIIAAVLALSLFVGSAEASLAAAPSLVLRLETIPAQTNKRTVGVDFVTLDTLDRSVTVDCYKKAPGDAGFVLFATTSLQAGGDSDRCTLSEAMTAQNGTYSIYAVATAGSDSVTAPTVAIDLNSSNHPGTPEGYEKSTISCGYSIKFRSADDGRSKTVEVYRSESKSFTADSGTRVTTVSVAPNTWYTIEVTKPDCAKDYYFALRAFDAYGNGSGLVGDVNMTYNDTVITKEVAGSQTAQTTFTTGALPADDVGGSTISDASVDDAEIEKQSGEETEGQTKTVAGDAETDQGSVLGSSDDAARRSRIVRITIALVSFAAAGALFYVARKKTSR